MTIAGPASRVSRMHVRRNTLSPRSDLVSPYECDPRTLVLVAFARLGEDERVGAVRIRNERRGLTREGGPPLAADDVGVAARGCCLVVVALERAVTRERVVIRVRGQAVDLQRRRPRAAAVERA